MTEIEELKSSISKAFVLLEANQLSIPDFIKEFKNKLDVIISLERRILELEKELIVTNDQIRCYTTDLNLLNTKLKPQLEVEAQAKTLREDKEKFEFEKKVWEKEKTFIFRENSNLTKVLNALLIKKEIKDSIWSNEKSQFAGVDNYNCAQYKQVTEQGRSKYEEVVEAGVESASGETKDKK